MSESETTTDQSVTGPSRIYSLISATLAVFLWGGWAWIANAEAAARLGVSPAGSAIAQGISSGCLTLIMVRANTWLCKWMPNNSLTMVAPAVTILCVVACLLVVVHTLVGTPNIARTVAPALVVAFCFNVVTTFKIRRAASDQ